MKHLAETSHSTWIKQKVRDQGAKEEELPVEVADHDPRVLIAGPLPVT